MSLLHWSTSWVSAFWRKEDDSSLESTTTSRPAKKLVDRPTSIFETTNGVIEDQNFEVNEIPTNAPLYEFKDHPLKPTNLNFNTTRPLQTNRWWQNLTLNNGTGTIPLYPYLIQCKDNNNLIISYPEKVSTSDYVISPFVANWTMNFNSNGARKLSNVDDLSVSMNFGTNVKAYFIRGCPYFTMEFNSINLRLDTIHAILSVVTSGKRTTVNFNNGQTWTIYLTSNMAWSNTLNNLTLQGAYTGVFRLALVPQPIDQNLQVLDQFSTTYPTGGDVLYEFPSDRQAYLHFKFKKKGGNLPLLMLALPHHTECLINLSKVNLNGYQTLKGPMTATATDQWTMLENLLTIQWFSPNKVKDNFVDRIKQNIPKDINLTTTAKDPYFVGKHVAKLARLALIAESVNMVSSIPAILTKIKAILEPWFNGQNQNKLVYDQTWGGLVTIEGINDSGADFGMGYYNDHHFHFGYFIYATAVLIKYDPNWVNNNSFKDKVLTMVRDFMNPNSNDQYFPKFRVKDFYDGHSWASGLFEFGDGKNQESTSESVNGYYAVYLLALALNDQPLINLSNLLLTTELRSSRKYWHMLDSSIYPTAFANNKTVGVLWNTKVDYATWFGKNVEFIHGIQMLPFTPISHALLDKQWVQQLYPILATGLTRPNPPIDQGWKSFIFMAKAVFDSQAAINEFEASQKGMDDGNTLSNTYYWFATQP